MLVGRLVLSQSAHCNIISPTPFILHAFAIYNMIIVKAIWLL